MVLDDSLVAAGDEDEVLDAGLARLVDHMLNQRPVDHRQHLLRHGLGGREEPGAQPGDRENGFADRFHELVGIVVVTLVASICLGIAEVWGCNGRWNAGGKAIKSYPAGRRQGSVNVRQPSEFPITSLATIESRPNAMARFAPPTGLLSAAALAATAWAAPAPGQGLDIRTRFNAPGAPAPTPAVQDWSGESGASNHPLMTAQAIRAAAANFRNCLAGLWPLAERRGVSRAVFEANVA